MYARRDVADLHPLTRYPYIVIVGRSSGGRRRRARPSLVAWDHGSRVDGWELRHVSAKVAEPHMSGKGGRAPGHAGRTQGRGLTSANSCFILGHRSEPQGPGQAGRPPCWRPRQEFSAPACPAVCRAFGYPARIQRALYCPFVCQREAFGGRAPTGLMRGTSARHVPRKCAGMWPLWTSQRPLH